MIDDLIIKVVSDNIIVKIEFILIILIEVKGKKGNNGNKIFELFFKVIIDKVYLKNMWKIFMVLKDDDGKSVLLISIDIVIVKE